MSGGLDGLRERLAAFLREKGLRAMTDWPAEPREQLDGPVAVVSLRGCQAGPAGFQHYLGERYDKEREQWVEVYGQKVQFTFGLDLYAPPKLGEGAIQAALDQLAGACAGAAAACSACALPGSSKPVAMTDTRISSSSEGSKLAPKMMLASGCAAS